MATTAPATERSTRTGPGAVHRGPPLGLLASVFVALFAASLVGSLAMTGGAAYPTPYDPPEAARDYFGPHADTIRIAAFLQFGAAIPLGLFTGNYSRRAEACG